MNAPDKLPPMNVAVVLHFEEGLNGYPLGSCHDFGWHDGVEWWNNSLTKKPSEMVGWSLIDAGLPEPRGLAEMWHEATRKHDGGLAQWEDQPEWCRERDAAVAAAVIDQLLRGG